MNPEHRSVRLSSIVFDEGLYPRVEGHDPALVQTYARDMDQIEAAGRLISINADNVLLDGRHRMLAYKKLADGQEDPEVTVFRYPVVSRLESFRLACRLQDRGKALSNDDRVASAKRLYALGDQSQREIAESLGVSPATVSTWLSRTIKEEKERKKSKAFDLWLACHTQEEIAEQIDSPRQTVAEWLKDFAETSAAEVSAIPPDFTPPIYNIWKEQTKDGGYDEGRKSRARWLENLLYLYTNPGEIVVDPFAGSGPTIEVCKKWKRRYFVSDREPSIEHAHEIRRHDLTEGLPKIPRWKDVKLVYLMPPSLRPDGGPCDEPTHLGHMSLDQFHETLAGTIGGFAKKLTEAYIALLISPSQWPFPGQGGCVDHLAELLRRIKLPIDMRISLPNEPDRWQNESIEWAKQNKRILVLTREIVVWRV